MCYTLSLTPSPPQPRTPSHHRRAYPRRSTNYYGEVSLFNLYSGAMTAAQVSDAYQGKVPTHAPTNAVPRLTHSPTSAPTDAPVVALTDSPTYDPNSIEYCDSFACPDGWGNRRYTCPRGQPCTKEMCCNEPVTLSPTSEPTDAPSAAPTNALTDKPTNKPTVPPTSGPTKPTGEPTGEPTNKPTMPPTEDLVALCNPRECPNWRCANWCVATRVTVCRGAAHPRTKTRSLCRISASFHLGVLLSS